MTIENVNLNTLHNDKWKVTFSNIPGALVTNPEYYDNFIKSFVFPDNSIDITRTEFMGYGVNHPMGAAPNRNLSPIQIEFRTSEDMKNYLNLFFWLQQLRYGQLDTDYDGLFRKYSVNRLVVEMLDNHKRTIAKVNLSNVLLTGVSSLPLVYGESEEVTFTTNWVYQEILFETVSIS